MVEGEVCGGEILASSWCLRDKQGCETLSGKKQEHLFAKAYTFQSTDTVLVSSSKYAAQNKGNTKKGERASNSRLQERM